MRRFIFGSDGEERCIEKLNDIIFQHQFRIKNIDGKTLLWGKKYSTSTEWGPSSGLAFFEIHPKSSNVCFKFIVIAIIYRDS